MQVGVHEAKTHLSRLIQEVLRGEQVVIARGGEPLVELRPLVTQPLARSLGRKGVVRFMAEDFDHVPVDAGGIL